ncbi:stage III sporulation protein AF [Falsibacillus albus]|uniref:Stage III sporulation protein AF n=1 Tax=Falsibacillus albus TaxID=2478915 RepID=A0A3L7KCF7_9BACI|nr:stage III sporulation protein AF [Falsibacillus albus]RLQ98272.1 stage III sporulation protein AF [Falsibacillus albus]
MSYLVQWITNIILFVLLTVVMDMLLPNSSFKKYTKMVTGLLLITIILTPVLRFISSDFDQVFNQISIKESVGNFQVENLIESKKKEIQASQRAYILEQMAVQMKKDAEEEMIGQFGIGIESIKLKVKQGGTDSFPENLEKITVMLGKPHEAGVVQAVKPVSIDTRENDTQQVKDEKTEKMIDLLANRWNLDAKSIQIQFEGGIQTNDER